VSAATTTVPRSRHQLHGIDQLCAVAGVSKRTLYSTSRKDELIANAYGFDPDICLKCSIARPHAANASSPPSTSTASVPVIAAAVEIPTGHSAPLARDYKKALPHGSRHAREAGSPTEQLGEQLALLDGASARSRVSTRDPRHRRHRGRLVDKASHDSVPRGAGETGA